MERMLAGLSTRRYRVVAHEQAIDHRIVADDLSGSVIALTASWGTPWGTLGVATKEATGWSSPTDGHSQVLVSASTHAR